MSFGFGFGLPRAPLRGQPLVAVIRSLFAANEPGVWYDPSDLSTLYQDSAGTTPVTDVEQPVGLMLDKSGGGNHASQPTATSRPVLSARVNLLTKTEQFDDVVWNKIRTSITANTIVAPDGTLTGDKLVEDTGANSHYINSSVISISNATNYTVSVYAKSAGRQYCLLAGDSSNSYLGYACFDLVNGTVAATTAGATASITLVGDGWYRCSVSSTSTGVTARYAIGLRTTIGTGFQSYTGDGTSGIYIWGADLRVANDGVNLPPYQRVNTATDYDTAGFPHYLRFDGVDDWLVTNTITPGIDKVQVFAGVRKLSDAAVGIIAELSATRVTNNGSFTLPSTPDVAGVKPGYGFYNKGTVSVDAVVVAGYPAPITNVLTGVGDISGDRATLRVNGTQAAQSTADQGTSNYLAYPLYIGQRAGSAFPFNGYLYSLIVRFGSNLPAATIEKTEKYINTKTRAY